MITVSESLKKGIESFLELSPEVSAHMENSENPHAVTKSQVGLGNVKNEEQATKEEFQAHKENRDNPHGVTKEQVGLGNLKNIEQATKEEFLAEQERVTAFMERQDNPHKVTKSQVGLGNLKDAEQATKEEFSEEQERVTVHIENKENPHFVTAEQVGLSKVLNAEQATAEQFARHISGQADCHSGADIMYSDTKSVKEKIDELIIEGGSGTMYHDELLNRDLPSQHPISAIEGLGEEFEALKNMETVTDEGLKNITEREFGEKKEIEINISGKYGNEASLENLGFALNDKIINAKFMIGDVEYDLRNNDFDIEYADVALTDLNDVDGIKPFVYANILSDDFVITNEYIGDGLNYAVELNFSKVSIPSSGEYKFSKLIVERTSLPDRIATEGYVDSKLSEKIEEVLVFEGITTGAQETALTSKTKSIFIDSDGYLLLPAGYAANFEAIIIGVREQNGIISDRNAVSYEMNGFIFKMNAAQPLCTDNTIIREKLTGSDGAVAYTCSLTGYPSKYFSVKGADGHRVFWKATLRLKNIVKVEGEA